MSHEHTGPVSTIYKPSHRRHFLLAIGIYQLLLGIRYLDPEAFHLGGSERFSWTIVVGTEIMAFLLFAAALASIVAFVLNRWSSIAFAVSMLAFSLLSLLWVGSMILTQDWESLPATGMYITFLYLIWLAAGVIDPPKTQVERLYNG